MAKFNFFGMAALAIMLCVNLVACSDDDDDNKNSSSAVLAGTTWKVIESDDYYGSGVIFTFTKSGKVFTNNLGWEEEGSNTYSLKGDYLKIDFHGDDYTAGTIFIDGNKLTYVYSWYDSDGEWGGEETNTTIFEKQAYNEHPKVVDWGW